jgi:hypothetical protein
MSGARPQLVEGSVPFKPFEIVLRMQIKPSFSFSGIRHVWNDASDLMANVAQTLYSNRKLVDRTSNASH